MPLPVAVTLPIEPIGQSARTLRDRVVTVLRESIVSGRLPPGARLSEPSLARELRVSRGPVREAMRELAAEGLVRIEARVGTFVTRPEAREVQEAFVIQAALEGLGARLACTAGTEDSRRARLVPGLEALDEAGARLEPLAYLSAARRFHEAIVDLGGNGRLAAIHRMLNDQLLRLCTPLVTAEVVLRHAEDHRAIAAAIVANRPAQAERLVRMHLMRSAERLLGVAGGTRPRPLGA